jgi:hypothetical protein
MSTTADPKTRSFPKFYARVNKAANLPKQYNGAMRYAGLIGAGIAELLHLKYLAPASVGDFFTIKRDRHEYRRTDDWPS